MAGGLEKKVVAIGYAGSPSTRLRIGQYKAALEADGFAVRLLELSQDDRASPTAARTVLTHIRSSDVVLVQRVLLPWLTVLLRLGRKPVVFDLDDAVHYVRPAQLERTEHPVAVTDRVRVAYRRVVRGSRYYSSRKRPLERMLALSSSAIFGNRTLKDELAAHCRGSSTVIPTCVPAYRDRRKQHSEHWPVTIGWVGMRSNLIYLRELEPAFRSLAKEYKGRLRLHVSSSTDYRSEFLPTNFTVWSLQREDDVVASFDIGVMPLEDDFHSRGKCAFKAVLYMSRGIPPVISPVGLNTELVKNGWNGYLASTPEQWHVAISQLVEDHRLRARLGENAFETIEQGFSTQHAYPLLKQIFEGAIGGKQADHDMRVSSSNVSL